MRKSAVIREKIGRQEFLRLPCYVVFFPGRLKVQGTAAASLQWVSVAAHCAAPETGIRLELSWLLGGASASVIDLVESQRTDHWLQQVGSPSYFSQFLDDL